MRSQPTIIFEIIISQLHLQLSLEQHGVGASTPRQSKIHIELLAPRNLATKSLLLTGILLDNINNRLTCVLYVSCIRCRILTPRLDDLGWHFSHAWQLAAHWPGPRLTVSWDVMDLLGVASPHPAGQLRLIQVVLSGIQGQHERSQLRRALKSLFLSHFLLSSPTGQGKSRATPRVLWEMTIPDHRQREGADQLFWIMWTNKWEGGIVVFLWNLR